MRLSALILALGCFALGGCTNPYPPTPRPDYTIRVTPTANGMVATPPPCPSWVTEHSNPYENQPLPQFGCATARNLAMMVERPEDLVTGRELGPANGVTAVGSMRRYNSDQTRGLIWTGQDPNAVAVTTSSATSSSISGELATGSAASSGTAAAAGP